VEHHYSGAWTFLTQTSKKQKTPQQAFRTVKPDDQADRDGESWVRSYGFRLAPRSRVLAQPSFSPLQPYRPSSFPPRPTAPIQTREGSETARLAIRVSRETGRSLPPGPSGRHFEGELGTAVSFRVSRETGRILARDALRVSSRTMPCRSLGEIPGIRLARPSVSGRRA